jgi:hypothetical protein
MPGKLLHKSKLLIILANFTLIFSTFVESQTKMKARSYRVNLSLSPLDFPAISGLGQSSIDYQSEPHLDKMDVVLTITKKYVLTDMNTNEQFEVLSAKSDYKILFNQIKTREDVYEFYKDATLALNEAYQHVRTQLPQLPNISFPNPPIDYYQREIDRLFNLLNQQN